MSYKKQLAESRDKAQVAYHEFALSKAKFPEHLFCFFEGKDNPYYVPRIRRFTDKYHPIRCGGRQKVLDVYRLVNQHTEYSKYRKAFFIDRDFNTPMPSLDPPIFETPCYSIENLYVSIPVFKNILTNEFHLSATTDTFDTCVAVFTERQREFHEAVCLLNAWYACLIEIRNTTGKQTGVILSDKLLREFIEISLNFVIPTYDFEKIKQTFPNANEVSEDILEDKIREFSRCEQHRVFRGKYEMQFLIKFIYLLLNDAATTKTVLKNKVNFAFGDGSSLNSEQAINIFEGYAETPESLLEYLRQVTANA
jgi:Protein of unknown function (DUF4435)